MLDFFRRNKIFILIVVTTFLVIGGGIFLMSGSGTNKPSIVNSSILVPSDVYQTSGYSNGTYLPASQSASVTLVEFGDYVCPACGIYSPIVKQTLTNYAGKVNYVFRNYPLAQHANAAIASDAAEAAGIQGKYWEMHDKLFSTQSEWSTVSDPTTILVGYAKDLGLNTDQFTSDMKSQKVKDVVQNDINDGNTVGITETPTFYLNGSKLTLSGDPNQLNNLIQNNLSK